MMYNQKMRLVLFLVIVASAHLSIGQTRFGGDSPKEDSKESDESVVKSTTKTDDKSPTSTRFFTGDDKLNAGIIGAAAGIGATLLGQAILGGNQNNGCGRRKRQAQGDARFFLGNSGGNNCNNPCGRRRKRQVKDGEEVTNTRLFGLFGGGGNKPNCGQSFNGNRPSNGFNQNGFNPNRPNNNQFIPNRPTNNGFNNGFNPNPPQFIPQTNNGFNPNRPTTNQFNNNRPSNNQFSNNRPSNNQFNNNRPSNKCKCTALSLIENGRELAKCQRPDETNRIWCYTTVDSNCRDAKRSQRYPNNAWSYTACSFLSTSTNVSGFGRSLAKPDQDKDDQGTEADQQSSSVNF